MNAPIKIALGNLWEHRSKTLILGILITLGVAVIVIGNSFLNASKKGLEKDFRAHYTADVFIHGNLKEKDQKKGVVTLFGIQNTVMVGLPPKTPSITDVYSLAEYFLSLEEVESAAPVISTMAMLYPVDLADDYEVPEDATSSMPICYGFAVDTESYQKVFPQFTVEGNWPTKKEPSVLLDNRIKEGYKKYWQQELTLGSKVLLRDVYMGTTLREVTVCGFYSQPDSATAMNSLIFIDQNTARSFSGLTYGSAFARDLPETVDTELTSMSEDDLFGSDSMEDMVDTSTDALFTSALTEDTLSNILGDTSLRDKLNQADDGAWHFMLLRLKNPSNTPAVIAELNQYFKDNDMHLTAGTWNDAALPYTMTTDSVGMIFTVLIVILAVVVFIIIMNTLIVSVIERTSEIGTMRALGANRLFIRKMFFAESVTISVIGSCLGVIIALIVCAIVNSLHIVIDNETAKVLLGSGNIQMLPSLSSILGTIFMIILGSVAANLYPVSVALKITPLKAMNQEA
jgi:putative ABC transport system permease protein